MIFVDTGPFLARHLARDQHHEAALAGWRRLAEEPVPLATSSHVLDETVTLLARRAGPAFAAERGRRILLAGSIRVLRPDEDDEAEAIALLERFDDQGVSFTDCVSFALMRRHSMEKAFTFDRHFEIAGFRRWSGEQP